MNINVTYIATLDDYYKADEAFRSLFNKKRIDLYIVMALGLIALGFIVREQYIIGGFVAIVGYMLYEGYMKRWIVRRNFYKIPNVGKNETLNFSEYEIVYECGVISETIEWDAYAAYFEIDQLFLLFYNESDHYAIIPKRSLGNDNEIDQLRKLFNEKLADYNMIDA